MKKRWFSAKCVFRHADIGGPRQLYEERVVLLRARGFKHAMKLAGREANKYADGLPGVSFTGYISVFAPIRKPEIYSDMEQSDLEPGEYLATRYPPKPANCEAEGREHRFYNKGNGRSACYHCEVVRPTERETTHRS
jgi:hypothetical protein